MTDDTTGERGTNAPETDTAQAGQGQGGRTVPQVELRPSLGRLTGKVALVTGSTSGIGEAIARLFAHEGASVVVTGRRAEAGEAVVAAIVEGGGDARFVRADVTVEADVDALIETTYDAYGRIDILVNNAGTMFAAPLADLSLAQFDELVTLDARSVFQSMHRVLPRMAEQGGGCVVNVTSLSAVNPMSVHSLYGFVKAGVTHMTRCVAQEYAPKGVRLNSLLPGLVTTPMVADDPAFAMIEQGVPMGRASTPVEQAYAALFLASDEASYVTGASLVVDGGI